MSAPEFRTQQLVIAAKRRQIEVWRSRLDGPGLTEANRRYCASTINALQRVVAADETATQQLQDLATKWVWLVGWVGLVGGVAYIAEMAQTHVCLHPTIRLFFPRCLHIALQNYGRALEAGGAHDLAVRRGGCLHWAMHRSALPTL
jgi:hypothetical protein